MQNHQSRVNKASRNNLLTCTTEAVPPVQYLASNNLKLVIH